MSLLHLSLLSFIAACCAALPCGLQPIAAGAVFDLKGLTSRIDRLLVQMEKEGVVVVPMITRLKAGVPTQQTHKGGEAEALSYDRTGTGGPHGIHSLEAAASEGP